jgi:hypothetical protein
MGRVPSTAHPTARRLLTKAQAASYCGLSVAAFAGLCPVRSIALGDDKRLERFDVVELNDWIDSLGVGTTRLGRDWLSALDKDNDGGSR